MSDKIKELIPELAEKLAKQRKVCNIDEGGIKPCVYDDGQGNHCLVGHIMNEDELREYGDFEGSIDSLVEHHPNALSQFTTDEKAILSALQAWHDLGQYQSLIDAGSDEVELKDRIEFELNYTVDNGRFWEDV